MSGKDSEKPGSALPRAIAMDGAVIKAPAAKPSPSKPITNSANPTPGAKK